jgi:(R,R)-butanediol dehydrogenase / meso-butanediol dehydrogenase / diacetyl reductase
VRAAILTEDHSFDVVEVPDPTPGAGEFLLRVQACGICGSDLKTYTRFGAGSILGHEFCGEIAAIGPHVVGQWRVGQLVAAMPLSSCGRCLWCLGGEPSHCEDVDLFGLGGTPGAFAEYIRVSAATAVALEPGMGDLGALVEPLAVGLHTVMEGDLRPGDRVLIIGGGNVGAAVSTWARRLGSKEVIVSDPSASRRDGAERFGATAVHDPAEGPIPSGFDVVFECVGAPGMVQAAIDAANVRGRVVIAGVCLEPDRILPITAVMKEVQLRFAVYYRPDEFRAAAALLGAGEIDASAFVTSAVGLNGVNEAFGRLLSSTLDRKVLVTPAAD